MKCQYLKDEKKREKQYREKRPWWKVLLGYCPCCGQYFRWRITTQRRLTQYSNPKNNYMTACKECHNDDDDYYDELWREHNASRL